MTSPRTSKKAKPPAAETKREKVPKKATAHQNLGLNDTIRLWVAAGGRCERCNKSVMESELTFDSLNLGERAHIVGQTEGGPRGDASLSPDLARSIDNILLLCQPCHKEIDDNKLQEKYSVGHLREMKRNHEERIHFLTDLKAERSLAVVFTTPIRQPDVSGQGNRDQPTVVHGKDVHEAMLPDHYPLENDPVRIRVDLPTEEDQAHWQAIFGTIKSLYARRLEGHEAEHLSVFALGKIPALVYFGRLLGDTRSLRLYNVVNGVPWKWQEKGPDGFELQVYRPPGNVPSKNVILLLSLSGKIEEAQYTSSVPEGADVYEIANLERFQQLNWLVAERQLKDFGRVYQALLGEIQARHGQDAMVHVLAAVPTAVAVEIGRLYRPNSHPQLRVYNCVGTVFRPALTFERKT